MTDKEHTVLIELTVYAKDTHDAACKARAMISDPCEELTYTVWEGEQNSDDGNLVTLAPTADYISLRVPFLPLGKG